MQRRAAALYAAFFLVISVAAYGMLATASPPTVSVEDPDHRLTSGSQLTVGDRTYEATVAEGSASLAWSNQSARHAATWEAGSTVAIDGTNYTVGTMPNATPAQVELTEVRPLGEGVSTQTINETEYVVLSEGENRTLVPVETYLDRQYGPAEVRTIEVREAIDLRGNLTTLQSVSASSATLVWTAPRTNTVDVGEGDVVDLAGRSFVAHFPDDGTLLLDRDVQAYQQQLTVQDTYDERINGLWGVVILSVLAAVLLLSFSYLPSRY